MPCYSHLCIVISTHHYRVPIALVKISLNYSLYILHSSFYISSMRPFLITVAVFILIVVALFVAKVFDTTPAITSFEQCVAAGHPVMESYPRQCAVPGGASFTEIIDQFSSSSASSFTSSIVAQSNNIHIFSPAPNTQIGPILIVTGEARVFENAFSYRLLDATNATVFESNAMANAPDIGQFGPFQLTITVPPQLVGSSGFLQVFQYSAKDGTPADVVTVPLQF